jgi:hypothetical protein
MRPTGALVGNAVAAGEGDPIAMIERLSGPGTTKHSGHLRQQLVQQMPQRNLVYRCCDELRPSLVHTHRNVDQCSDDNGQERIERKHNAAHDSFGLYMWRYASTTSSSVHSVGWPDTLQTWLGTLKHVAEARAVAVAGEEHRVDLVVANL